MRWGSFFISVINHDESTYIVIANELLRGEVYLRDVIDTKPIGIFWIYAALIKITGGSISVLRLAAAITVGLGSWGLFLANLRALKSERAGIAAGLAYTVLSSVFGYYGLSPNTEIFFNTLTIAAVVITVAVGVRPGARLSSWRWLVTGALLGFAVCIKPFAAAEALAIGLFLVHFYSSRRAPVQLFLSGGGLIAAFLLPILGVWLYYQNLGITDTLLFYSFEVNAAYPIDLPWYLRLKYMGDYLLRFSPFVVLAVAAFMYSGDGARVQNKGARSNRTRVWMGYLLLQFVLVTAVVLTTGKRFGHYQIQLHPVLALMAGAWWATGGTLLPKLSAGLLRKYTPSIILAFGVLVGLQHYIRYGAKEDTPAMIADYLADHLQPNETFFTINGRQITYYLLDRNVPTPYVHSSLLFYDHHVRAFQIDEVAEADRLVKNENLRYLVSLVDDDALHSPLSERILPYFTPIDTIHEKIVFWRRATK